MKIDESYIARRRFLHCMLGGGAGALAAGAAVPVACYLGNVGGGPPPPTVKLSAAESTLLPGESRVVRYDRIPVLLFRTPDPDGALRAFVATCTHFDCIVGYRPQQECIFCACHEGYYDLEGNVTDGPPPEPLRPVYHKWHDDVLILALEEHSLETKDVDEAS